MFKKLADRWKVSGWNFLLIIATFAIGGSFCGFAGRKLILWTGVTANLPRIILYIFFITVLWPLIVLLISIPLGQFAFFKNYLVRVWSKIGGKEKVGATEIAIFASGAGTNAGNIINYFKDDPLVRIRMVVCNNSKAGVIKIAKENNIEMLLVDRKMFNEQDMLYALKKRKIGFIVLAGFLWQLPPFLINGYPQKIINIHPALLPAYGGKGMYGRHIHEAVMFNKEKQTGITIHFVDEVYDHGKIIFQKAFEIDASDSIETIAQKIHTLEFIHFPAVIKEIIEKQNPS